jgi:hypothetical protein
MAIEQSTMAIVARVLWLVFIGAGLGVIGLVSLLNGLLLFIKLGGGH